MSDLKKALLVLCGVGVLVGVVFFLGGLNAYLSYFDQAKQTGHAGSGYPPGILAAVFGLLTVGMSGWGAYKVSQMP
ncbi:MAG: hypothetical protein HY261_11490 [Chloroflexi bacterium]|nr:hypothetical protein [Chloroflexota bacterium]